MNKKQSGAKMMMIITAILLGIIAIFVVINHKSSETSNEVSKGTSGGKTPSIEGQPILGEKDAPVTVVEFGDFKCPSCNVWGEKVFPKLVHDYVKDGKVKFANVNVLFHGQESILASLAAESVWKHSPDAYWDFHKAIYKEQPEQTKHDEAWVTNEKLVEIAKKFPAINADQLKQDLEKQQFMDELKKDEKLVKEFAVTKTPTIMVNGHVLNDPFDYDKIKSLIDKELEASK